MAFSDWCDYTEGKAPDEHTVVGTLKVLPQVYSPQLNNRRDLYVYLPPSYAAGQRRYPVLYMHDGQNLFDASISFAGEWRVDETMETLSAEGVEAIVVGIPHMGARRLDEYSPFVNRYRQGGHGDQYLDFLADTVKPLVDRDFRTLSAREHTGIAGSSMGGFISLYGFFRMPHIFGFAGVFSPAFGFERSALFACISRAAYTPGKIYMDVGTQEVSGSMRQRYISSRWYTMLVRQMRDVLRKKGYRDGDTLRYVEEKDAAHSETDWARRLPDALRFLLAD